MSKTNKQLLNKAKDTNKNIRMCLDVMDEFKYLDKHFTLSGYEYTLKKNWKELYFSDVAKYAKDKNIDFFEAMDEIVWCFAVDRLSPDSGRPGGGEGPGEGKGAHPGGICHSPLGGWGRGALRQDRPPLHRHKR